MSEYQTSPSKMDVEDEQDPLIKEEVIKFKTNDYFQKDFILSLSFFGLILILPLLVWDQINHEYVFIWQGCMITITVLRWINQFAHSKGIALNIGNNAATFLTLLDGLGWGLASAFIFPIESILAMALSALMVIGIGGAGASIYAARKFIAIIYLLSVTLPFLVRLGMSTNTDAHIIALALVTISSFFCFVALLQNTTFDKALNINDESEEELTAFEEKTQRLQSMFDKEKNHTTALELKLTNSTQELDEFHDIIDGYNKELYLLAEKTINLLNDINSLKQSELNSRQTTLLSSIEESALSLSHKLNNTNSSEPDQNFDQHTTINHDSFYIPEIDKERPTNPKRVLIVNNDLAEQEKISACLDHLLLDFEVVVDIPAALNSLCEAEAKNTTFDLIIVDAWSANMDGLSFAECLREDSTFHNIEYVMLDTETVSLDSVRLENIGIDSLLKKPLQSEELVNAIFQALSHQKTNLNLIKKQPSNLPASIESLIEDALHISSSYDETNDQSSSSTEILDEYILEGLLSSKAINFPELVTEFIEEVPMLIEGAKQAYKQKNYTLVKNKIRELGTRSLHMGSITLLELAKEIEDALEISNTKKGLEKLDSIKVEFIKVESLLLGLLVNDSSYQGIDKR